MVAAALRRTTEPFIVESLDERDGQLTVMTTERSGFGLPVDKLARPLAVGGSYTLECVRATEVVGVADALGWLYRLTDEDIERRDREMVQRFEREKRERYEASRQEWERRSAALPHWLQARLRRFHDAAGERFALDGWGYELAVCELAWAYSDDDQQRVDRIDAERGCSGNQHDCARYLARVHREGGDAAAVPAALAPLTGSVDYREASHG